MSLFNTIDHKGLYAITDREIAKSSHLEIVSAILAGGGRLIQLREKTLPTNDFYQIASLSVEIAHKRGAYIIINDRVDIAKMVKADGVHLGQDDLSPEKARLILGQNAIIGLSTHSLTQALMANKLPIDYIAVGPVFRTLTKPEASKGVTDGQIGLDLLKEICLKVNKPIVAIGGITLENALSVLEAGASAVAVISDLVKHSDISKRTTAFLENLKR
ncbi:MAG: thiamine phosphate synthase [Acidobacteria bacterium]|nr:thiamine phosphate synthase [Acidobacteriota bacterium]